jgi:hypothetical protein
MTVAYRSDGEIRRSGSRSPRLTWTLDARLAHARWPDELPEVG